MMKSKKLNSKHLMGTAAAVALALLWILGDTIGPTPSSGPNPSQNHTLTLPRGVIDPGSAFAAKRSDVQVQGSGIVARVLADDLDGSRHQRFILRLPDGQTLLVAHNIDLANRIKGLRKGDRVAFLGEYEWNERGGVLHWTHRDPAGRHMAGWLRHAGVTYH